MVFSSLLRTEASRAEQSAQASLTAASAIVDTGKRAGLNVRTCRILMRVFGTQQRRSTSPFSPPLSSPPLSFLTPCSCCSLSVSISNNCLKARRRNCVPHSAKCTLTFASGSADEIAFRFPYPDGHAQLRDKHIHISSQSS
eukprot:397338-Pleurochrysis_carterae.AAC.4